MPEVGAQRRCARTEPAKVGAFGRTSLTGRPKRELSPFGPGFSAPRVSARCEGHGVEHRPEVAQNGYPERGNPLPLSVSG